MSCPVFFKYKANTDEYLLNFIIFLKKNDDK